MIALARKRAPLAIKNVDTLTTLLDSFIYPGRKPVDAAGLHWQSWVAFACLAGLTLLVGGVTVAQRRR